MDNFPHSGNVCGNMAGVKSVERAISLLGEVGRSPRGLVDLAEATALPTSTTARLLATLEDLDAVRRDDDGHYYLGPTVGALAAAERGEPRLRDIAQPYLEELALTLDEAVGLSVVSGEDNVTISQVDTPRPVQAENWQGTRWPMAQGPAGYAVLSTWSAPDVADFVRRHPEVDGLAQAIAATPASGVWWSVDHYVDGLTSAVVPLPDADGVAMGAIYAYGPSYRFPLPGAAPQIEAALKDHARHLARAWRQRAARTLEAG